MSTDLQSQQATEEGLLVEHDRQLAEPGDHDRFAHYVRKSAIVAAAINGTVARALCGKQWVPNRDPSGFTKCPRCVEIYEGLPPEDDDAGGSDA